VQVQRLEIADGPFYSIQPRVDPSEPFVVLCIDQFCLPGFLPLQQSIDLGSVRRVLRLQSRRILPSQQCIAFIQAAIVEGLRRYQGRSVAVRCAFSGFSGLFSLLGAPVSHEMIIPY
jgi:hypothetical protein